MKIHCRRHLTLCTNFFLLNCLDVESDFIWFSCMQKKALTGVEYPSLTPLTGHYLPTGLSCRYLKFAGISSHPCPLTGLTDLISPSLQHSKHQLTFPVMPPQAEPCLSCLAPWCCSAHVLGFLARPGPPPKGRDPQSAWPACSAGRNYALFHVLNAWSLNL